MRSRLSFYARRGNGQRKRISFYIRKLDKVSTTPSQKIRNAWDRAPLLWIFGLLGIGSFLGHLFW